MAPRIGSELCERPVYQGPGLEERGDDVGISRPAGPGIWRRQIRKGRKAAGGSGEGRFPRMIRPPRRARRSAIYQFAYVWGTYGGKSALQHSLAA